MKTSLRDISVMAGDALEPELSVSALKYHRGDDPCVVISLAGRAGIADCTWVRPLLEMQAAQGQGRLVVDLSGLSSMDWWVALMLIWAGRVVSRRGGVLELASPQPAVAQLLAAAGAPEAITVRSAPESGAARGRTVKPPFVRIQELSERGRAYTTRQSA